MSRFAYVNGHYVQLSKATTHIEDRGYQFADGIYEVIAYQNFKFIDMTAHMDRLERSLKAISIPMPMSRQALLMIAKRLIVMNKNRRGIVYIQISRGIAKRDHAYSESLKPSLVMTARRLSPIPEKYWQEGVSVITEPDLRWKRCDIKSIGLLPNVLSKQKARSKGAYEAWLINDKGFITEGCSTNSWIITKAGEIITHPSTEAILNGIARNIVIEKASQLGLKFRERSFTRQEAFDASEAFLSSTTTYVLPITQIDGQKIGNGKVGHFTSLLFSSCQTSMREQCELDNQ
jgi:D-alanine transaminase